MTSQPEGMGKIMHLGTQNLTTMITLSRRIVLIAAGEILPLDSSLQYTERGSDRGIPESR